MRLTLCHSTNENPMYDVNIERYTCESAVMSKSTLRQLLAVINGGICAPFSLDELHDLILTKLHR